MACIYTGCTGNHKNMTEHFADTPGTNTVTNLIKKDPIVANTVTNSDNPVINKPLTNKERAHRWRVKHRDEYNEKMRKVMRKVRAK